MRGKGRKDVFIFYMLLVVGVSLLAAGCAKKGAVPEETAVAAPAEYMTPAPVQAPPAVEKDTSSLAEMASGLENVYFDFDKYSIRPDARCILKKNADIIMALKGAKVVIEGHCDERGSTEYNLALGQRRAEAAQDYVVSLGVDSSTISTVSYGEERPVDPGQNEKAWAKNRRAHFAVSGLNP